LEAQVSILNLYRTLSAYLDTTQDQRRGLELGQRVLKLLENYSPDKLASQLGAEFVGVIDNIAKRQLGLKLYENAETSYKKALSIWRENKSYDTDEIRKMSATIYHQLGYVAQDQRQWQQAEQYYQQALQIKIEFNAHYEQASTYHELGRVAQAQRQWQQAEQYYQQALQIKIEFNAHYEQASTYSQLGLLAQEQRQWQQAEQYYQQTLQIYIEFNAHYEQASTYHNLGIVAQEQQQWQQAEQYYQQALQIKIEFQDRYSQASTYLGLGVVAHDLQQWQQAGEYFLQGLQIYMEYEDNYHTDMASRNLALLWKASDDVNMRTSIAKALGKSVEETGKMLLGMLEEPKEEQIADEEKKE